MKEKINSGFITAIVIVLLGGCTHIKDLLYEPAVVLVCTINGDIDSLAGNILFPNTCVLVSDTIRMYFYSTNFRKTNAIREGDLIRLDLYPVEGNIIGTKNVLFHMARYHESNASYTVNPADTVYSDIVVQMQVDRMEWASGGEISISNLVVTTSPIAGTSGEHLVIKDGKISGHIQ
ncbi:MAG: hypothetical protein GX640_10570 [Fibrobacter sp.]|nr:hypothetical protein [Fibrobacter sp.]